MKSIKELYKIGRGPSSSHTMGPEKAAKIFRQQNPTADRFSVTLYGSLAKTGKGHLTDRAILEALAPIPTEIIFNPQRQDLPHPNTLEFLAYQENKTIGQMEVISIGGGAISIIGQPELETPSIYPHNSFKEIADYCREKQIRLSDYVEQWEGPEIWDYLSIIWKTMIRSIEQGLAADGILPGGLEVERKAKFLYGQKPQKESEADKENRVVCAYAFAVSEQNADGGIIVTAPTCGSCGVLPAALRYLQEQKGFSEKQILKALAVGGVIGNLIKTNASISGAECGCQAEIGSACSMTAAAIGELENLSLDQIEYAAEIAMEHHLGLTCDPIHGLVQIPCIERNAVAAMRAINAISIAHFLSSSRKISFDLVIQTMYETGKDMCTRYRETSEGGLAKLYKK